MNRLLQLGNPNHWTMKMHSMLLPPAKSHESSMHYHSDLLLDHHQDIRIIVTVLTGRRRRSCHLRRHSLNNSLRNKMSEYLSGAGERDKHQRPM